MCCAAGHGVSATCITCITQLWSISIEGYRTCTHNVWIGCYNACNYRQREYTYYTLCDSGILGRNFAALRRTLCRRGGHTTQRGHCSPNACRVHVTALPSARRHSLVQDLHDAASKHTPNTLRIWRAESMRCYSGAHYVRDARATFKWDTLRL